MEFLQISEAHAASLKRTPGGHARQVQQCVVFAEFNPRRATGANEKSCAAGHGFPHEFHRASGAGGQAFNIAPGTAGDMTTALMNGALRQPESIPGRSDRQASSETRTAPLSRSGLARAMRDLAEFAGAQHYCLADLTRSHAEQPPRLLSSNWSLDAIEIVGASAIEQIYQSSFAVALGDKPVAFETGSPNRCPRVVDETVALRMLEYGHGEVFLLRLRCGLRRGACVLSAPVTGRIRRETLRSAHLRANHLMSRYGEDAPGASPVLLSERERECLRWVSEGKTTEEIALILSVSGNTVNKYIVSSVQKLSAGNRTMAMAMAIRNGLI